MKRAIISLFSATTAVSISLTPSVAVLTGVSGVAISLAPSTTEAAG